VFLEGFEKENGMVRSCIFIFTYFSKNVVLLSMSISLCLKYWCSYLQKSESRPVWEILSACISILKHGVSNIGSTLSERNMSPVEFINLN